MYPLTGCLILLDGSWRRAVVKDICSDKASVNVKLIDTGSYHEVQMDSVSLQGTTVLNMCLTKLSQ